MLTDLIYYLTLMFWLDGLMQESERIESITDF